MINNLSQNFHSALPSSPSNPYELNPCKGFFSIVTSAGQIITLNSLGVKVLSYIGGGMPPVENIMTPLGILGGSILQRTLVRPRTITLACAIYGRDLLRVQRIKQSLINLLAPSISLQTPASIKLRYQLIDNRGNLLGESLEVPVIYAGDLTGITDNLYEERFALQFLELAPPGITELNALTVNLALGVSLASASTLHYRDKNGNWTDVNANTVRFVGYDNNGLLWYDVRNGANNVIFRNINGTNSTGNMASLVAAPEVRAAYFDVNGDIYIGGSMDNVGYNYVFTAATSTWSFNSTIQGGTTLYVNAIESDAQGRLYFGGEFTSPHTYGFRFVKSPAARTGFAFNGIVKAIKRALDGSIIWGGAFTNAGGVTGVNGVVKHNVNTDIFTSMAGGVAGGSATVNAIEVLPNGNIVIGGSFTSAGGVPAINVAMFNGTGWQAMGAGLPSTGVTVLSVNSKTGELYAAGDTFLYKDSVAQQIVLKVVKWNGTTWLPTDFTETLNGGGQPIWIDYDNVNDGFALSTSGIQPTFHVSTNAVTYAGTAECFPQIKITGPGRIISIINYTTGQAMYFDYNLIASEIATLQAAMPGGVNFSSNLQGNVIGKLFQGSNTATFSLKPGVNNIGIMMRNTSGTSKVELIYKNTHWSFEAGV